MTGNTDSVDSTAAIAREDVTITTRDGSPAIEVGGAVIELDVRLIEEDPDEYAHNREADLDVSVDAEGDVGAWWELDREDGTGYPRLTIEPWFDNDDEEEVSA